MRAILNFNARRKVIDNKKRTHSKSNFKSRNIKIKKRIVWSSKIVCKYKRR